MHTFQSGTTGATRPWSTNTTSCAAAGAQAIVLVADDDEAAILVREIAALPKRERLPVLSHWGITGGEFVKEASPALQQVDLTVIQTFSDGLIKTYDPPFTPQRHEALSLQELLRARYRPDGVLVPVHN
jgi:hypothetical protein